MLRLLEFVRLRRPSASPPVPGDANGPHPNAAALRSVTTRIGRRSFRVSSDDDYLDHVQGNFEPAMVCLFEALVRPDDVVLDVGANIGCTSLLFGQLARQVYALEPSPSTFALLKANLARARLTYVFPVNLGLGRDDGEFELTFSADNRAGAFVSNLARASDGHCTERVRIVRGDSFLQRQPNSRVDFIKIDVEGFERPVIEGLSGSIAASRPVVVLELNHWCLNVFQRTTVPDFLDFLRGVFPLLYAVDEHDDTVRDLHDRNQAYHVMYHHITGNRYCNLVGAFDGERIAGLRTL